MGKRLRTLIVTAVSEDGFVSVYGPYFTPEHADRVVGQIELDDSGQKTMIEVHTLSYYETEGGTVV